MLSSDFHGITVFATPPSGADGFRVTQKFVGPVATQAIGLAPAINPPATSQIVTGAYPRFRFQGTFPAEYNKGANIDVFSTLASGNAFTIVASSTYLMAAGNALAYDFTMPDVAGLAAFPAAARLTAGANDVSATAFGFTGAGIFDLQPSLGSEFKAAARGGPVNVP
jgi:hypothetical protein